MVFADLWSPQVCTNSIIISIRICADLSQLQATNREPPCSGFDTQAREESKTWLGSRGKKTWGGFTPTEEVAIAQFGTKVASIINDILKRYVKALRRKLRDDGPLQRMIDEDHIALVFSYLHEFHVQFEQSFGYMDEHPNALGSIADDTLRIRTTAFGAKLVAGLMMADRIQAAKLRQYQERKRIGFLEVDLENIPKDRKDCPVCKEEMSVKSPDGTQESCLHLVICCGQYVGETCLKTWLHAARNEGMTKASCPNCRYIFPPAFMEKLLGPEDESEEYYSSDDFEIAESIAPEFVNLITPSSSPQIQLDPNQESQVELAVTAAPAMVADSGHMEIDLEIPSDDDF